MVRQGSCDEALGGTRRLLSGGQGGRGRRAGGRAHVSRLEGVELALAVVLRHAVAPEQYLDEACGQLEREGGGSEHACSAFDRWLPRPAAMRGRADASGRPRAIQAQ